MLSNEREEKISEVRALFLSSRYGRFDHLIDIFNPAELQKKSPCNLIQIVYKRLNLEEGAFNHQSFRVWLERYKAKLTEPPIGSHTTIKSGNSESEKVKTIDNFSFTNPSTIQQNETSLIKKAK